MTYLRSYKELIVWQKSIELVKEIFLLTNEFPKSELYGIILQMRKAAVSIPSNIAEGYGRKSINEYKHFLSIAYGSALELETQIIITRQLKFSLQESFEKSEFILNEICKMLNTIIQKLDAKR